MKRSAGILAFKTEKSTIKFFLVHPGGPFFARKDEGVWTIPKGEYEDDEDPLHAAIREFAEETGTTLKGNFIPLGEIKQKGGKYVRAWAINHEIDETKIVSNTFEIEWPPKSGKRKEFPEIDKAGWFTKEEAMIKMNEAQRKFVEMV